MGNVKKYGLLGFYFIFDVHSENFIDELKAKFTIRDIMKDYTSDVSYDEYSVIKKSKAFNWLTIYFNLDEFRFSISEHQSGTIEVWFGFYPEEDINKQSCLLSELLEKSAYCICGFEFEMLGYNPPEIDNDSTPHLIIRKGLISKSSNMNSEEGQIVARYVDNLLSFEKSP
jgi:hypothetical protein